MYTYTALSREGGAIMWRGWLRKGGACAWLPVVQARSEDQCWRELLAIDTKGQTVDKAVLPADRRPSQRGGLGARLSRGATL
jgi:hypothetical protein